MCRSGNVEFSFSMVCSLPKRRARVVYASFCGEDMGERKYRIAKKKGGSKPPPYITKFPKITEYIS